ncbi:tRNA (N6-threonylcarbamoyladenosine(37)-N6)-methyltransferase TrmO [Rheinheimera sp.]|uniref:tRNA (N6-threonylcarbamoyladenosine(37)-N6)-methyltransferase TrmO n=1 Tax=Rheinheimera sp. TaxID=1869214 RepID=UPI0027B98292|nr:tRNA (N6-threonylcarbamoyladenosine(37)-N6)-methyltransferase TrmO [Rheinheimera sp.]
MKPFELNAVGVIESPYKQKFAIPRQPGLIPEAKGALVLSPPYADDAIVRGIESFSHLWLVFVFHETADKGWSPLVRPPRLGGNDKKGVFATRATFRPNPIGLSVVKLDGVQRRGDKLVLLLSGIDLLDGTPVLDIKPYLPYADALPGAAGGFADAAPQTDMTVSFSEQAIAFCQAQSSLPDLQVFIEKVLKQDPRPPYKKQREEQQSYGMTLYHFNIKWTVDGEHNHVTEIRLQQDNQTSSGKNAG